MADPWKYVTKIIESYERMFSTKPKKARPPDMILPVISLYLLRSNNLMTQTSQLKCNNQAGSTLVLWTILLPLVQVQNSLEVLVF